jgi:type IV fimbrial biogenesis protein FimT
MQDGAVRLTNRIQGFTLIELVVAMVVFAILLSQAMPLYQSMTGSMRARSAAERLLQDIQWAQSQAIAHNTRYIIAMSASDEWDITNQSGTIVRGMSIADFNSAYPQVTLAAVSGTLPVTINSLGAPIPAGTYSVTFTPAAGARVWTLTISPTGTGSIS